LPRGAAVTAAAPADSSILPTALYPRTPAVRSVAGVSVPSMSFVPDMNRLLFAVLLVAATGIAGRAGAQVRPQGDLNFIVGVPQGSFSENVDDAGFGLNLFGGLGVGRSPVVVGLELGFMVYGFERRNEPFSTTIPDVTVDVETSNNIMLGHFV